MDIAPYSLTGTHTFEVLMDNSSKINFEIMLVRLLFTSFFIFTLALLIYVFFNLPFRLLILIVYVGLIPLTLLVYAQAKSKKGVASYYLSILSICWNFAIGLYEWYRLNDDSWANPASNIHNFIYFLPFFGFILGGVFFARMSKGNDPN